MKKTLFWLGLFLGLVSLLPQTTHAQTYTCVVDTPNCVEDTSQTCPDPYVPADGGCDSFSGANLPLCSGQHPCALPTATPFPTPTPASCPTGAVCYLCQISGSACVLYAGCPTGYVYDTPNGCLDHSGDCEGYHICVASSLTPTPTIHIGPNCSLFGSCGSSCCPGQTRCVTNPSVCCADDYNCPAPTYSGCVPVLIDGSCPTDTFTYPCSATDPSSGIEMEMCCMDENYCSFLPGNGQIYCVVGSDPEGGIKTALGCVPIKAKGFTGWFLRLAIPFGGVVTFIVFLYAALRMIMAGGDPGKIQSAKQLITAALSGLILIILALFILNLFGVQILNLPQF